MSLLLSVFLHLVYLLMHKQIYPIFQSSPCFHKPLMTPYFLYYKEKIIYHGLSQPFSKLLSQFMSLFTAILPMGQTAPFMAPPLHEVHSGFALQCMCYPFPASPTVYLLASSKAQFIVFSLSCCLL